MLPQRPHKDAHHSDLLIKSNHNIFFDWPFWWSLYHQHIYMSKLNLMLFKVLISSKSNHNFFWLALLMTIVSSAYLHVQTQFNVSWSFNFIQISVTYVVCPIEWNLKEKMIYLLELKSEIQNVIKIWVLKFYSIFSDKKYSIFNISHTLHQKNQEITSNKILLNESFPTIE
jgi:hypothetical protein